MNVRIYEVTPRDGLQNEPKNISTENKLELIHQLVQAGYKDIEVTSFVKPSWIPQLKDGEQVLRGLKEFPDDVRFWSLIPNRRGMERALDAGVGHIATFMSASEAHNRKNLNRTQQESLENVRIVTEMARDEGVTVRAYLSTVFGCPYEGPVDITNSIELVKKLLDFGAQEVSLGDTTGMGNPLLIKETINAIDNAGIPLDSIALHLHDTEGTAMANVLAGYQMGIRCFDGSTAGVGGCPYAPGAAGNVATEDMINMFEKMGVRTDVDLDLAAETGIFLSNLLEKELPGRYYRFHQGKLKRQNKNTA
jgi:hydroxymethylglutaryl-CoA lyase